MALTEKHVLAYPNMRSSGCYYIIINDGNDEDDDYCGGGSGWGDYASQE